MSGAVSETFVFAEILKGYWNCGLSPSLYYYRDTDQQEIALVIEQDGILYPVEIKKTATLSKFQSKNFHLLSKFWETQEPGVRLCLADREYV